MARAGATRGTAPPWESQRALLPGGLWQEPGGASISWLATPSGMHQLVPPKPQICGTPGEEACPLLRQARKVWGLPVFPNGEVRCLWAMRCSPPTNPKTNSQWPAQFVTREGDASSWEPSQTNISQRLFFGDLIGFA